MDDTEKALLKRIVEEFCNANENSNAPQYMTATLRLSVPEVIALRKLRNAVSAKVDLSPKYSCL